MITSMSSSDSGEVPWRTRISPQRGPRLRGHLISILNQVQAVLDGLGGGGGGGDGGSLLELSPILARGLEVHRARRIRRI